MAAAEPAEPASPRSYSIVNLAENKLDKGTGSKIQDIERKHNVNNDKISELQLGSLKLISSIQSLQMNESKQLKLKNNMKKNITLLKSSVGQKIDTLNIGNVKEALVVSEQEENSKFNYIFEIPKFSPASVDNILYLLNNLNINYNINPVLLSKKTKIRHKKQLYYLHNLYLYNLSSESYLINKFKLQLLKIKQNQHY